MTSRVAGVLLHPTSLPNGVLDEHAWWFLDWMKKAGLSVWQVLPLTAPHDDLSPYHSLSAFALNPRLLPAGWQSRVDEQAFADFLQKPPAWLEDYALFMVLREKFQHACWSSWPQQYRLRDAEALAQLGRQNHEQMQAFKREQFYLFELWKSLRRQAAEYGIELFGDMPIFVAYNSVEVWCQPQQFRLDKNLQ